MSRSSALRRTLELPPAHALEVISVSATGDCFYDCIRELLVRQGGKRCSRFFRSQPLLLRSYGSTTADEAADEAADGAVFPSAQFMRDYVAENLSSEQLDMYNMYAAAGLDEYHFSANLSLGELKQYAKRSGKTNGPGKCFWADEFALRQVSDGLEITLLIIDDEAASGGGASAGRKRRRNGERSPSSSSDGRFVSIGRYPHAVILHRSRRQHYNAVVVDGFPVITFEQLPLNVRSLWQLCAPRKSKTESKDLSSDCGGKDDAVDMKEERNECRSEKVEGKGPSDHCDWEDSPPKPLDPERKESTSTAAKIKSSSPSPSAKNLGNFYCGCAGFSSSSWVGNFYPRSIVGHNSDRQLSFYQQHFRAVEINSTFYGIPSEATVKKWKSSFANSFKVSVKAPKGLTHEQSRLDCSVLSLFMSRMQPLNESLACILIQCPRTLAVTVSELKQIKSMLKEESWYKGCIAFEFRNEDTYFDAAMREFLKLNSFALVMHPNSLGRSTIGTSVSGRGDCKLQGYQPEELSKVAIQGALTSNVVYLRLHGYNDEHSGDYSIDDLRKIAVQIHSWRCEGLEVYCFILNDQRPPNSNSSPQKSASQPWDRWSAMPKNAKQLEMLVYGLSGDDPPDAPRKPKSTLHNFFQKKE